MGVSKSKICRAAAMMLMLAAVPCLSHDRAAGDASAIPTASTPVQTAGFGGVLVSKRFKMILGFVQTLPA